MHSSHTQSQIALIQHTQRRIGTRLLPMTEPLSVTWHPVDRALPFDEGVQGDFQPISEGTIWGRGRENAWFHLKGRIPAAWAGRAAVAWVDLGTEALVYQPDGRVLQGLNTGAAWDDTGWRNSRPFIHLHDVCQGGEEVEFWIDAACWAHPGAIDNSTPVPGQLTPAGTPLGRANHLALAVFETAAWELFCDIEVLLDLARALPETSARRARILHALVSACERYDQTGDFSAARAILSPALDCRANASDLDAVAIGHGHLDSAWLWDFATGRRKIARTASNQLRLIERFPGYVFGCTSAAHYRWLEEDHPGLWNRVRTAIGDGSWEILGAMWVEPDCLIPSGESLIRQCLHGIRYFQARFGHAPTAAWLPDTFGFSSSLPQILRHCGCDMLITTKLSWNQCNPPRHHSFRWRGIDGSELLVHFPPDGDYESSLLPSKLIEGQGRYAEKAETDAFITPFGYGDGGGGPHERHLMRAKRGRDLEGMPRIRLGTAASFQEHLRARRDDLPIFTDELYQESHVGTLTTHGDIKRLHRRLEQALMATEILLSHAPAAAWPSAEMDRLWKTLLIHEFHDVLPGTSIREVYEQALPELNGALADCARLADGVVASGSCDPGSLLFFNSLALPWTGVVTLPQALHGRGLRTRAGEPVPTQREGDRTVAWISVTSIGFLELVVEGTAPDALLPSPGNPTLDNGRVRAVFDPATGLLTQLNDVLASDGGANLFSSYHDYPAQWDAWNLELGYRNAPVETAQCSVCRLIIDGPVRQVVKLEAKIGGSDIRQQISLARPGRRLDFATEVEWRETHRFLRVAFPTRIPAAMASYHIQHGWIQRPTHPRTEIDTSRIEHAAHHYVDLSQPGLGLALLNDCKYGQIVDELTIDLGLLRSPVFPDPQADRGHHEFTYSLLPHEEAFPCDPVFAEADRLNRPPMMWIDCRVPGLRPPLRMESAAISLETLKQAEDGKGWIVRLSNRSGLPATARLTAEQPRQLTPCNGLEETIGTPLQPQQEWNLALAPFAVQTWRIAD